jgi:hypothetical protein
MDPEPAPSPDPSPAPQPPPGKPQPGPMSDNPPSFIRTIKSERSSVEDATAKAREHLQRQQTRDARSYGGRRTGLVKDEAELARTAALEERLRELARRAIRKDR